MGEMDRPRVGAGAGDPFSLNPSKGGLGLTYGGPKGEPVQLGLGWNYNGKVWESVDEALNYSVGGLSIDSEAEQFGWGTPTMPSLGEVYKPDGTYGTFTLGYRGFGLTFEVHEDNPTTNSEANSDIGLVIRDENGVIIGSEDWELVGTDVAGYGYRISRRDLDGNLISDSEFRKLTPIEAAQIRKQQASGYVNKNFMADPDFLPALANLDFLADLTDKIPINPDAAENFIHSAYRAKIEGSTHRENGSVEFWSDGTTVGITNPDSYYSDNFLDGYGKNVDGHAHASFGAHVRAFADGSVANFDH